MGLLDPTTAVESGGFFDDADAVVTDAKWVMYTYAGKAVPAPGLLLTLNDGEREHEEFYTCGEAKNWQPSRDGRSITSPTGKTAFEKKAKVVALTDSLFRNGFPRENMGDDPADLIGLKAHWKIVPLYKIEEKEIKALVAEGILKFPWENGGGSATSGSNGVGDEARAAATDAVLQVLADSDGAIKKKDLVTRVFSAMRGSPHAASVFKAMANDEFIVSLGVKMDGDTISIA